MAFEVDLRSDTVTQPCCAMRQAMASAEVGDDVIDRDPTVERLQEYVAELLGKEAAIFMPSGTMTNQIALRLHCQPGDEFLCESECHIVQYEQGAYAQLSGLAASMVTGTCGVLQLEQLRGKIRPLDDHTVRTKLVCIENTHNRGGGTVQPIEVVEAICDWAHSHQLNTHLDGARLMNAVVASGISAARFASRFDSVSLCLSKGLGAPVGSLLVGTKAFIQRAKRARKLFGGGMRQSGILAAAGLYALQHNIDRLAEDHLHAQLLGEAVSQIPHVQIFTPRIETNIVLFRIDPKLGTADELEARAAREGLGLMPFGEHLVRLVTHLNVTRHQVDRAIEILRRLLSTN